MQQKETCTWRVEISRTDFLVSCASCVRLSRTHPSTGKTTPAKQNMQSVRPGSAQGSLLEAGCPLKTNLLSILCLLRGCWSGTSHITDWARVTVRTLWAASLTGASSRPGKLHKANFHKNAVSSVLE